jgi:hypothetical protein
MLIAEGRHPKLIDDEYFREVQDFLRQNSREPNGRELRNPFAGMLYCRCGHAMTLRTYKNSDGTERCAPRFLCTDQAYCKCGSCTFQEMQDIVAQILRDSIRDFEFELEKASGNDLQEKQAAILKARLEELSRKEISQWEKYSEDGMPKEIFEKLNRKLLEEKAAAKKALEEVLAATGSRAMYEEKICVFRDALAGLFDDSMPAKEKNRLLRLCIERITYSRERPDRLRRPAGEKKGTSLSVGGGWSSTEIHADFTLKL